MAETNIIDTLRLNPKDTGSADVQIARLTQRIAELSKHLESHKKDHSCRPRPPHAGARRRRFQDYLKRTAADRYANVIKTLNLRK
jgi:small subunit ribosomal protein S15